jgi:hypothetical protein
MSDMEVLQLAVIAAVLIVSSALSHKPAHGDRRGSAAIGYWLSGYCIVFFGIYTVFRVVSPEVLAGADAPNDGAVWRLATVGWGATAAGSFFGQWVRKRFRSPGTTP